MVFEPNFTKVVSSSKKNLGITQSIIELKLPTNEELIDTVYSVSAKSTIVSSEVTGNDINFVGLVDFQAIYASLGVSALDYSAEFKDKFVCEEEVNGEVVLTSNVIDVTSNIVSNGIKVVAIVETVIDLITSQDVSVLVDVNGDDLGIAHKDIEFDTYIGKAYEKFDVSEEFDVKNATKILMVTPSVCISSVMPYENYANVSGLLNVDVCYQMGDDISQIASDFHSFEFNWDVALSGMSDLSYIQSAISIMFNEIKVSTMLEEGGASVSLFVPIVYTGYVFNKNNLQVVDDIYSKTNYLSVTSENFDSIVGYKSINFKDAISGSASIAETAPFIDEILGVCTNNIVLASSRLENEKLNIEGVANATVVYYTKETNAITSIQVEVPFSIEQKVDGEIANVATLCLVNLSARSKRGKEIEVSSDLSVYVDMYGMNTMQIISSLSLGEEKQKDDCSLYIYIAKPEDSIWDIAKEMNVSEDLILSQNPELELPLKGGEKIIIYNPTLVGFE